MNTEMPEVNSYEEQRRRQIEDNRRKLDELRLHALAGAVRQSAAISSPRKSLKRKTRPPREASFRRSGRVASLPDKPDYRDAGRNITRQRSNARGIINRPPTSKEINYAVTKAEELANTLSSGHPTFVKSMTLSYATGTALSVPSQFGKYHFWKSESILLVDEVGQEFDVLYHVGSFGPHKLSGGWREFALNHKLVHGDCLVFQLIEKRKKFKVYIIRAITKPLMKL